MQTFEILNGTQLNKLDRDIGRIQETLAEYTVQKNTMPAEFGAIVSELRETVVALINLYNFNMDQRAAKAKARIDALEKSVQQAKAKLGMVI